MATAKIETPETAGVALKPCTTQLTTVDGRRTYAPSACALGGWGYFPAKLAGLVGSCA